jgi:hypothetical protein
LTPWNYFQQKGVVPEDIALKSPFWLKIPVINLLAMMQLNRKASLPAREGCTNGRRELPKCVDGRKDA